MKLIQVTVVEAVYVDPLQGRDIKQSWSRS